MAEEMGIVVTMTDRTSSAMKTISSHVGGFNKAIMAMSSSYIQFEKQNNVMISQSNEMGQALFSITKSTQIVQKGMHAYSVALDSVSYSSVIQGQEELTEKLHNSEAAANASIKAVKGVTEENRKASNSASGSLFSLAFGEDNTDVQNKFTSIAVDGALKLTDAAMGDSQGAGVVSSLLSGMFSGAMAGAPLLGPGMIAGALIGGLSGLASGVAEIVTKRNEAFGSYVQNMTENVIQDQNNDIKNGSAVAAQREEETVTFDRLLGKGKGAEYLTELRERTYSSSAKYSDLTTISSSLASGFKDDLDEMLKLTSAISGAGLSLGLDTNKMNTMAAAMNQMETSGKVTLNEIGAIQAQGVDAIGMLAEWKGVAREDILDIINDGAIQGSEAVDILTQKIQELYGSAMDQPPTTFNGIASQLANAEAEMQNAYGEGYNEERIEGMKKQIDFLTGENGKAMQEANKATGAWMASLENSKEEYIRNAQTEVLESDEYKTAMAEETTEGYEKAGRMLMQAKVHGINEYNASEGAQLLVESEIALAEHIRLDASSNSAYWDAGLKKGEQYNQGIACALERSVYIDADGKIWTVPIFTYTSSPEPSNNAYGLNRVPYDNFPALLHEGERVLTASQARQADKSGASPVQVTVTGNSFYGSDEALEQRMAYRLAHEMKRAMLLVQ